MQWHKPHRHTAIENIQVRPFLNCFQKIYIYCCLLMFGIEIISDELIENIKKNREWNIFWEYFE